VVIQAIFMPVLRVLPTAQFTQPAQHNRADGEDEISRKQGGLGQVAEGTYQQDISRF
jgi:hypothetical protein